MKRLGVSLKVATVFTVVTCALAGSAASALAVSIEPLNTKFETLSSGEVVWQDSGGGPTWHCEKGKLSGTTSTTKTNVLEATPTFSGCKFLGLPVEYTNICAPKTVPWALSLDNTDIVTLKTNCSLSISFPGGCVVTAPAQTIPTALLWHNRATNNLEFETTANMAFESLKFSSASCESFPLMLHKEYFAVSAKFLIKGLHAS